MGKQSSMSSSFSIAIVNGTCLFPTVPLQVHNVYLERNGFMFDPELKRARPPCELCTECVVSMHHILMECTATAAQRREYLQSSL